MPPLRRLLPLALLLIAGTGYAQSADEAERTRLSEEMKRLSGRNAWRGVDESYKRLEALMEKGVKVGYKDHYLGAVAARELGNLNAVYVRLQRAKAAEDTEEVRTWLADIESNFGPVKLRVDPKFGGDASLNIAEMPFAPDQRRAIEAAQIALKDTRVYDGLLPLGAYTFGGQAFEIKPGGGQTIEMALQPSSVRDSGGGGLSYVGPRLDVGLSWFQSTDPSDEVLAASSFGGPGARVGVGVEAGFTTTLGLVTEVGYHNLFSGSPEGVPEGVETRATSMHLGYGWLAAAFRAGDLRVAAGPVYALGVFHTTGMNGYCAGAPDDEACPGVGSDDNDAIDYAWLTGKTHMGGAEIGLFYGFLNFGKFQSGLGLHAGAFKDDARWYPWGQLAFTLAPAAYRRDG